MNNRACRLSVSMLMVGTLLMLSCGPRAAPAPTMPIPAPAPAAPIPTTPAAPTPVTTPTLAPGPLTPSTPAPAPLTEKPKYGGTFNILQRTITENFDGAAVPQAFLLWGIVYEHLTFPDWAKGLAGSSEVDFGGGLHRLEYFTGNLAEKFEIPEIGKWVFQIRRDVHFALDPSSEASRLMNGRELTADDVVWSQKRLISSPSSSTSLSQPALAKTATIEKTGPWEVTLKTPQDPMAGWHWIAFGGNTGVQYPREVVEKYGSTSDWRNVVGTGPYILKDFVSGSVATLVRNPNYWGKDPAGAGKGNHLPYVDTIKYLIVPDLSTRLASMRTGKADWITEVEWEDATSLMKTVSSLQYKKYLPGGRGIAMRTDKPDLPFKDRRVRQALMLATDFEALKRDLYLGEAEIHINPVAPVSGYGRAYVPMNELPEAVQALYRYNPERAKQLLAEAGYPKGFKTKVIVQNNTTAMDLASAVKAMWANIGVDLELQPKEEAVFVSTRFAFSWDEILVQTKGASMLNMYDLSGTEGSPFARISDPVLDETSKQMQKNLFLDMPKVDEAYRKLLPYILEKAYVIPTPAPYSYTMWQPWVKNHHGETALQLWLQYAWIDQDLKEKTIGRR